MKAKTCISSALLSLACIGAGVASCQPITRQPIPSNAYSCRDASAIMLALEKPKAEAIDPAVSHLSCYSGAQAERVEVALGNMLTTHPKTLFSALHKHVSDPAVIGDIVTTQPWHLVDKPCQFEQLLNQRLARLKRLDNYPHQSQLAQQAIADFLPTVAAGCTTMSGHQQRH